MMLKKIIRLLCLINLLLIAGCKKQELKDEFEYLEGNWVWQYSTTDTQTGPYISDDQNSKGNNNTLLIQKKGYLTLFENGKKKHKYRLKNITSYYEPSLNQWHYNLSLTKKQKVSMYYWINTGRLDVVGFFLIESKDPNFIVNYFYKQP